MWFSPAQKRIYLDYAGGTPVHPSALSVMRRKSSVFGNPGAIHNDGVIAASILNEARRTIAGELACKPREIVFTSGGTESNNLAILGLARRLMLANTSFEETHWVISSIEHPSVLECFSEIERLGGVVTHIDPDEHGLFKPDTVLSAIRKNTVLLSIGWANGEIGTVQSLRDISHALRAHPHVLFHTDAGQAPLYLAPHVHTLGVDMMTLDSGKLCGPRGIAALYISNRVELAPIMLGGGQERELRPGTENPTLAAGFAEALRAGGREREGEMRRLGALHKLFLEMVTQIPGSVVNGEKRVLPNIANISIPDIQSEYVTLALDARGFFISTKSACREGNNRRSHVVEALGEIPPAGGWRAENTLRFSFGRDTTERDVRAAAEELKKIAAQKSA